ncbi:MAG: WbqC family protein [Chloroflexi bacterium]|nr:WbqC family protein [Chloroflexota bacterium]
MKKVAVIQSNYIPWKGYFDIIHDADLFIFYDDVQFTKNDWRNRNRLKTPGGAKWLSIPVGQSLDRLICEVTLNDSRWAVKHWKTISQYYSRAPFFKTYSDFFEHFYLEMKWDNLSDLNHFLIKSISRDFLGIDTEFKDSRDFFVSGERLDRLFDLLKKAGTDIYISGPSAKNYIDERRFQEAGIKLIYKDYTGYPEYSQFYPPFIHEVSILDLLFHAGPDAGYYIWGWRESV